MSIPRSKRDIQSFLGKINFVKRFIPNFSELVKHTTSMLKKDAEIKWTNQARSSFKDIKKAIMEAPTLIVFSPNYYSKLYQEFLHLLLCIQWHSGSCAVTKRWWRSRSSNCIFSKTLRDVELKYDPIEKQDYALIKSLKTLGFTFYMENSFPMSLQLL